MKKIILFVCLVAIVFSSCKNKESEIKKIDTLKKELFDKSVKTFDAKKAQDLINLYVAFVKDFPKDTNSANFLFDAANVSEGVNPKYSIELLNRVIAEYPDSKRVPDCMFYKGFTYDEKLKDVKNARESYEVYLKKYPNHVWAKNIPDLINMLGKTPEQIGEELTAKQHKDSLVKKK